MRARETRRAAVALLLCAAPAATPAFEWTGRVGLLYTRDEAWTDTVPRSTRPHLDLDLRLDLADYIQSPGMFSWSGGVAYRRITDDLDGARVSKSDAISYRLSAAAFQNPSTPIQLRAFAERSDSTIETPQAPVATSDRISERFGGALTIQSQRRPSLVVGYVRDDVEESIPTLPLHTRTTDTLDARARFDATSHSLDATYRGDWSDGSWDADQYRQHAVGAQGRGRISSRGELHLSESYLRREPTGDAATGFRIDANNFGASYREGLVPGDILSVSYRFVHGLTEVGPALAEAVSHSARHEQDFPLGESRWFVRTLADLSYSEQRTDLTEPVTGTGGTGGALLWWRRAVGANLLEWNAGPLFGVLRSPGEDLVYGYGGSAALRAVRPWNGSRASLWYDVSYQRDLFGVRGWALRQTGTGALSGNLGEGRATAQLSLSSARQWGPVLGDDARRSVTFSAGYVTRRYTADAQLSVQSGVASLAGDTSVGDGIFLPTGFDVHTFGALAGGTWAILPNLQARIQGRASSSQAPGQPDVQFLEGFGSLTYRFAALDLGIEDRYFTTRTASGATNGNVLMLRVSRTFGTRY